MAKRLVQTQLDQLRWENEKLLEENRRLRGEEINIESELHSCLKKQRRLDEEARTRRRLMHLDLPHTCKHSPLITPGHMSDNDCTQSSQGSLTTVESASSQIQQQLEQAVKERENLEKQCTHLEQEIRVMEQEAELKQFRAMELERGKWEAREDRLVEQMRQLERRLARLELDGQRKSTFEKKDHRNRGGKQIPVVSGLASLRSWSDASSFDSDKSQPPVKQLLPEPTHKYVHTVDANAADNPKAKQHDHDNAGKEATCTSNEQENGGVMMQPSLSRQFLQQLPPLSKFNGEQTEEGETFKDWLAQFEMVADVCGWKGQIKLAHLVTRLKGQALAFYRTCTSAQTADYAALVAELTKQFTPVHIPAIQTSVFHDCQQKAKKSVNSYAQDLRKLFIKALPTSQQGSKEAEEVGKTVLANQFVVGLAPELKRKVAGTEGNFEQLLTKARFEEAKLREITVKTKPTSQSQSESHTPKETSSTKKRDDPRCTVCGGVGHNPKFCRYKGRGTPTESVAKRRVAALAGVVKHSDEDNDEDTCTTPEDSDVEAVLTQVSATMHALVSQTEDGVQPILGPTITAEAVVEGVSVNALLDTVHCITRVHHECSG